MEEEEREELLRKRGNICFRNKKYEDAIKFYFKALKICKGEDVHILHSNLAAAFLRMREYVLALKHSNICVEKCPTFGKGYLRLIRSYIGLSYYDYAKFLTEKYLSSEDLEDFRNQIYKDIDLVSCSPVYYRMKRVESKGPNLKKMKKLITNGIERKPTIFDMPVFHTFVYEGEIMMFGGTVTTEDKLNELLVLENTTWRVIETKGYDKPKYGRSHHRIIVSEETKEIFIWGGRGGPKLGLHRHISGEILRLDMVTKRWEILPSSCDKDSIPKSRSVSAFGRIGDLFYIIGGSILRNNLLFPQVNLVNEKNMILVYDLKTRGWTTRALTKKPKPTLMSSFSVIGRDHAIFTKNERTGHDCVFIFQRISCPVFIDLQTGDFREIDFSVPDYIREKLPYDKHTDFVHKMKNISKIREDILKKHKELRNVWNGEDFVPFPMTIVSNEDTEKKKIISMNTNKRRRKCIAIALVFDRYLLQVDVEKRCWEEVSHISNTKIVDDVVEQKMAEMDGVTDMRQFMQHLGIVAQQTFEIVNQPGGGPINIAVGGRRGGGGGNALPGLGHFMRNFPNIRVQGNNVDPGEVNNLPDPNEFVRNLVDQVGEGLGDGQAGLPMMGDGQPLTTAQLLKWRLINSNQFQGIVSCRGILHCFPTPSCNGNMKSIVLVRMDSERNREFRSTMFKFVAKKVFSDIVIQVDFY